MQNCELLINYGSSDSSVNVLKDQLEKGNDEQKIEALKQVSAHSVYVWRNVTRWMHVLAFVDCIYLVISTLICTPFEEALLPHVCTRVAWNRSFT
jgi:hypothetical protein